MRTILSTACPSASPTARIINGLPKFFGHIRLKDTWMSIAQNTLTDIVTAASVFEQSFPDSAINAQIDSLLTNFQNGLNATRQ